MSNRFVSSFVAVLYLFVTSIQSPVTRSPDCLSSTALRSSADIAHNSRPVTACDCEHTKVGTVRLTRPVGRDGSPALSLSALADALLGNETAVERARDWREAQVSAAPPKLPSPPAGTRGD